MIHIGKLIEEELRRQERSVTWFADKLCCERTNVYSIFKRQSIDTVLLLRISLVLHRNFFSVYLEELEKNEFKQQNGHTPEDYKNLLREIAELKKSLAQEKLRADFYEEMVAFGKEVYGIDLKKAGTK